MLLVDEDGGIVWQYGKAGVSGFGFDELNPSVILFLRISWEGVFQHPLAIALI